MGGLRGASAPLFLLLAPAWVAPSRGDKAPAPPPLSRARLARCGTSKVCGPCRAPRPCCLRLRSRSPLRVAAGCGVARLHPRFALRGRAGARPLRRARRPLALGSGCALACRRGWRGLAPAALRLGLRVLALAPLRRGGVGPGPAPSGLRAAPRASPAALCPASRSRRGAARLSGCRPRWPRCVAFRPPAWVCSVAGAVVRLRARVWGFRWLRPAGNDRPLSRAGKVTSFRRFPYKYGDDIL